MEGGGQVEEGIQTGRSDTSSGNFLGYGEFWNKCSPPLLFCRNPIAGSLFLPQTLLHRLLIFHSIPFFSPKVKIWFQNKRSKYKKLLKQNCGGLERDFPSRLPSLAPCSPRLPSLWDLPKAGTLTTGGSGNSFGAWYQRHSPNVLASSQMM